MVRAVAAVIHWPTDWPIYALALAYLAAVAVAMPALGVGAFHQVTPGHVVLWTLHGLVGVGVALHQFSDRRLLAWLRSRLVNAIALVCLIGPFYDSFTSWKQGFYRWAAFTWDMPLHQIDVALHGRPAWEWLAPLLTPLVLSTLDWLYFLWFAVLLGTYSAVIWIAPPVLRRRFLLTTLLLWIVLGSVLAPLLASGGPCYYAPLTGQPDPYAALWPMLDGADLHARRIQAHLWTAANGTTWSHLTGISAFPSLHVAQATLIALLAWQSRHWLVRLSGVAFVIAIQMGSVVLGWHYAIDGYVSIAVTCALWDLTKNRAHRFTPPSTTGC